MERTFTILIHICERFTFEFISAFSHYTRVWKNIYENMHLTAQFRATSESCPISIYI